MKYRILFILLSVIFIGLSACKQDDVAKPDGNNTSLTLIPDKEGMTVKGKIINSVTRNPIQGILVSDGRLFAETDKDGIYYLPTNLNTQRTVFVVVPKEYEVPMTSSNCFGAYKLFPADAARNGRTILANFALKPKENPLQDYLIAFGGDPQIYHGNEELAISSWNDVTQGLAKLKMESDIPLYAAYLGDLVWNQTDLFGIYKKPIEIAGVPTFNIPGNHDHDHSSSANTEYLAVNAYVEALGPKNYSTNIGDVHYIFLDALIFPSPEPGVECLSGLDDEALEFLENDLKHVDKGTPLMIAMHVPMAKSLHHFGHYENYERMSELLAGYDVNMWFGHFHIYYNYSYTAEDLLRETKARSMESHLVGRVSGALFMDRYLTTDGVPPGYQVCKVSGKNISWSFYSIEKGYEQMRIYTPDITGDNYIYANVFLWDNKWGIPELWIDGKFSKKLADVGDGNRNDPMYLITLQKNNYVGQKPNGDDNYHLFRTDLPATRPLNGEIRINDRFGQTHTATFNLK